MKNSFLLFSLFLFLTSNVFAQHEKMSLDTNIISEFNILNDFPLGKRNCFVEFNGDTYQMSSNVQKDFASILFEKFLVDGDKYQKSLFFTLEQGLKWVGTTTFDNEEPKTFSIDGQKAILVATRQQCPDILKKKN